MINFKISKKFFVKCSNFPTCDRSRRIRKIHGSRCSRDFIAKPFRSPDKYTAGYLHVHVLFSFCVTNSPRGLSSRFSRVTNPSRCISEGLATHTHTQNTIRRLNVTERYCGGGLVLEAGRDGRIYLYIYMQHPILQSALTTPIYRLFMNAIFFFSYDFFDRPIYHCIILIVCTSCSM